MCVFFGLGVGVGVGGGWGLLINNLFSPATAQRVRITCCVHSMEGGEGGGYGPQRLGIGRTGGNTHLMRFRKDEVYLYFLSFPLIYLKEFLCVLQMFSISTVLQVYSNFYVLRMYSKPLKCMIIFKEKNATIRRDPLSLLYFGRKAFCICVHPLKSTENQNIVVSLLI